MAYRFYLWELLALERHLCARSYCKLPRYLTETTTEPLARSSNNPASLTSRLGVTIDVEQNHVRFLGDLILNLWDCGGQDSFMQSYLTTQQSTIFSHVGVLIYVFDVQSREMQSDLQYFRRCLDALRQFSPEAAVFLLVHKMDLVGAGREATFERRRGELIKECRAAAPAMDVTVFGTSIYDESLYKVG